MRIRLLLACVLASGCHWALNDPGTDPPKQQLYFPAGIVFDTQPDSMYAYVSNGNADLRYGGGTVQMIDATRFECAIAKLRLDRFQEPTPDALTARCAGYDPSGDIARGTCRPDPRDPQIIDCDETPFILPNATIKVGNFAGTMKLRKATSTHSPRLFLGVRGDPSITVIDIHADAQHLNDPVVGPLDCFANDTAAARLGSPPGCDSATHLVQDFVCRGQPTCQAGDDNKPIGTTQLPAEPFGMSFELTNPPNPPERLLVAHLSTGQVSLIDHLEGADTEAAALASTSTAFFAGNAQGHHGAFALAPRPPVDDTEPKLWYMTSNLNSLIATFRVAEAEQVVPGSAFTIQPTFVVGNDVRAIAFDTGNRLFVTDNFPPSVVTIDTHIITKSGGGSPANLVTNVIDVCQTPSHMGKRSLLFPDGIHSKLVVVCFLSSQVMVVDPDRPGVDDTIFAGLGGPNDLAFTFDDDSADNAGTTPLRHAWVTNYTESTIAVIDLQPGSPTQNQVIARLGFPADGPNPGIK
jgi:hypothetical protein